MRNRNCKFIRFELMITPDAGVDKVKQIRIVAVFSFLSIGNRGLITSLCVLGLLISSRDDGTKCRELSDKADPASNEINHARVC